MNETAILWIVLYATLQTSITIYLLVSSTWVKFEISRIWWASDRHHSRTQKLEIQMSEEDKDCDE